MASYRKPTRKVVPSSLRIMPDTSRSPLDLPSTITLPTEGNRFWNEEDQSPTRANKLDQGLEIKKLDKSEYDSDKKKASKWLWCIITSIMGLAIWVLVLTIVYILHVHYSSTTIVTQNPENPQNSSQGFQPCITNDNCTGTAKYCDTKFTHQCVNCISSNNCEDPNAKYCDIFGTKTCHQCIFDKHCTNNTVCDIENSRTCVECIDNSHCAGNDERNICDTIAMVCTTPCTTAMCASRTDGKTKCCGTRCIEECPGGFACDILQSQCILKKPSGPKGSNVPKSPNSYMTTCTHCHDINLNITGSMFKRADLETIEYMTGFEYIFGLNNSNPNIANITNVTLYYQEAPNCNKTDFGITSFLELGVYSSITQNYVDFENILPVKSDCFFILTKGNFEKFFTCTASNDFNYQVYNLKTGTPFTITHTPFYELYGY